MPKIRKFVGVVKAGQLDIHTYIQRVSYRTFCFAGSKSIRQIVYISVLITRLTQTDWKVRGNRGASVLRNMDANHHSDPNYKRPLNEQVSQTDYLYLNINCTTKTGK